MNTIHLWILKVTMADNAALTEALFQWIRSTCGYWKTETRQAPRKSQAVSMNTIHLWILKDRHVGSLVRFMRCFNEYDPLVDTESPVLRLLNYLLMGFNEYDPLVDTESLVHAARTCDANHVSMNTIHLWILKGKLTKDAKQKGAKFQWIRSTCGYWKTKRLTRSWAAIARFNEYDPLVDTESRREDS